MNEQIRISPVRLVGEENEQIGVVPTFEALKMAREAGLDLVEVAPNVRPPVCRIMNYGKWKYTQKKNSKKHHEQQLKEVRMRPKTDTHDREIKLNQALKFFKEGDKVQFTMIFRGREQSHREIGYSAFRAIVELLGTKVKVERPPLVEGRRMIMILSPVKGAFGEGDDTEETEEDGPEAAAPPTPTAKPAAAVAPPPPAVAPREQPTAATTANEQ